MALLSSLAATRALSQRSGPLLTLSLARSFGTEDATAGTIVVSIKEAKSKTFKALRKIGWDEGTKIFLSAFSSFKNDVA
jgi:hypothetical protein